MQRTDFLNRFFRVLGCYICCLRRNFMFFAINFITNLYTFPQILIHCQMGVSRSASCTIAFIMKEYEQSFKDTLHTTKAKRNCVKPNPGFHTQLEIYEEILRTLGYSADLSNALREREVNEP